MAHRLLLPPCRHLLLRTDRHDLRREVRLDRSNHIFKIVLVKLIVDIPEELRSQKALWADQQRDSYQRPADVARYPSYYFYTILQLNVHSIDNPRGKRFSRALSANNAALIAANAKKW
jgi:hypothetical protein